jgi:hypothetical protein
MHSAGARALREDDNQISKEAVLLQWERKCEVADRLDAGERPEPQHPAPARRFVRSTEAALAQQHAQAQHSQAQPEPQAPLEPAFERAEPAEPIALRPGDAAVAERRTITITGQPTPARRRRAVMDAQLAQPDRIALWAFLLGLLLVAVAAGTAHA